jgi:hypothetical protein
MNGLNMFLAVEMWQRMCLASVISNRFSNNQGMYMCNSYNVNAKQQSSAHVENILHTNNLLMTFSTCVTAEVSKW